MKEYINPEVHQALVEYCAPVILGRKPAALFTLSSIACLLCLKNALSRLLSIKILRKYPNNFLVMVYDKKSMSSLLSENSKIKNALNLFGYDKNFSVKSYLAFLKYRFRKSEEFPHEIGVFLGYPLADVFGFIRNKGQEYKYCGIWKVYGNEEYSRRCFDEYKHCGECLRKHLSKGGSLKDFNMFYEINIKEKKEGGNFYE